MSDIKIVDKIETMEREDLIPYHNNPKEHPVEQVNKIASSIKEYGFTVPILIDEDNEIIAGHGRYQAADKLDVDEVPVIKRGDLSDSQVKSFRLMDNKVSETGWDDESLVTEIENLEDMDVAIEEMTGFDDEEINEMVDYDFNGDVEEEPVPDEPGDPTTEKGDLWILGDHRLLCGDATNEDDVEKLMDGEQADMVFTDPPYGIDLDTDYSKMPSVNDDGNENYNRVHGDDEVFDASLLMDMADEVITFGANYYTDSLPDYGRSGSWLVWDKRGNKKYDKMIGSGFELAWSKENHKQKIYRYNNTLFGPNDSGTDKKHPTQKPVNLCIEMINDMCNGYLSVVDLFCGSGSTLIACEQTNRQCYGMEIDPHYCDVIVERWENLTGKEADRVPVESSQKHGVK